jgi:hypothetical protein
LGRDWDGEIFLLEITGCTAFDRADRASLGNGAEFDTIACAVAYPSKVFLMVEDTDTYDTTQKQTLKNNSWKDWFWYVIVGIMLFLMVLGYFVYRWWVNKRLAEAEVQQTQEDIDGVVEEQEQGFGGDLNDDQVHVNPLNTQVAKMRNQGAPMIGDTGQGGQVLSDQAEVRVDKFAERQEFGPSQMQSRW